MEKATRQSRRFACERCRSYKLRCERTPSTSLQEPHNHSCDRCRRTGATCVTSADRTTSSSLARDTPREASSSSTGTWFNNYGNSLADTITVAPIRQATTSCEQPRGQALLTTTTADSMLDYALQSFTFPVDEPEQQQEKQQMEQLINSNQVTEDSRKSSFSSSLFDDLDDSFGGYGSPLVTIPSPLSTQLEEPAATDNKNWHTALLDLGAFLLKQRAQTSTCEQQSQDTGCSDHLEHTIQQALEATSRFKDLLDSMVNMTTRTDILLATTLITTYLLLARTWRRTFGVLHGFLIAPASSQSSMSLPSLQFGGFQVRNNPAIQILVLLEVASGLLQIIESSLGIVHSTVRGGSNINNAKVSNTDEPRPLVFPMDPVAISIRETLLTQEMVASTGEEGVVPMSLRQVMDVVKQQLAPDT
ncbi:hypothetical protein QBC38DRAFT_460559 [Podospora fimiseda]|uniref:Zn(2)-C6 fungal-type domain-containing protein n=1 Tax=Podospora fimiseda TaxID=252190 RepID=A0AAN7BFP2_9PEZI|nr:hypothetical protein QBC38DRAFT_460559 [Podospora fimiseda]